VELENEKNEIEVLPRMTNEKKKRLSEIEKEMVPLKKFLEDAKAQRRAIKEEIGMIFRIH
jgi:hypothetical protein